MFFAINFRQNLPKNFEKKIRFWLIFCIIFRFLHCFSFYFRAVFLFIIFSNLPKIIPKLSHYFFKIVPKLPQFFFKFLLKIYVKFCSSHELSPKFTQNLEKKLDFDLFLALFFVSCVVLVFTFDFCWYCDGFPSFLGGGGLAETPLVVAYAYRLPRVV